MKSKSKFMRRLALVGGSGLIGRYLQTYFATHNEVRSYSRSNGFDIRRPERLLGAIKDYDPDVIVYLINSFTINETDCLTDESERTARDSPLNFFQHCSKLNSKIVFFSSDHVFDGKIGNYSEEDEPTPLKKFGAIKRELEKAIIEFGNKYIIIRTSAVYGAPNARKDSFENWALTMLTSGKDVEGFGNVVFSPTYVKDIAVGLEHLLAIDYEGVIHLSGIEACSRFNFLKTMRGKLLELNPNIGRVYHGLNPSYGTQILNTSLNSNKFWNLINQQPTLNEEGLALSTREFKSIC